MAINSVKYSGEKKSDFHMFYEERRGFSFDSPNLMLMHSYKANGCKQFLGGKHNRKWTLDLESVIFVVSVFFILLYLEKAGGDLSALMLTDNQMIPLALCHRPARVKCPFFPGLRRKQTSLL